MAAKCEAKCGCRGERSCLVCDEDSNLTSAPPVENEYHQCVNCGYLLIQKVGPHAFCYNNDTIKVPDHVMILTVNVKFGGVVVMKEFISKDEETALVERIDSLQWAESVSGRRKQDYGPKVNFKRQKVKVGPFTGLPDYSRSVVGKLQSVSHLATFHPVEMCNLDYTPERGSAIVAHRDDEWVWGERLVTVNLISSTTITFTHPEHSVAVHVPLPARSLVVVTGAARHCWLHSIARHNITARRIAMTFRELASEFMEGGAEQALGERLMSIATTYTGQPTNFTNQSD